MKSGEHFQNSGHPDDDANQGRLPNPTGHGGVYKVDGHGRPEPSVREENSTFLPCHGARSLRPPLDFFPIGLARRTIERPAPVIRKYEHIRRSQNACYDEYCAGSR